MSEDGGMGPEDFGLGSDFDQALAEATEGGDSGGDASGSGPSANSRLARTDFSKLKMILDVPLKVSVELGRTKMLVNDLLQLKRKPAIICSNDVKSCFNRIVHSIFAIYLKRIGCPDKAIESCIVDSIWRL